MNGPAPGVRWTGIGSWPGTDMAEALRITFDLCPDLPYLPELPDRGAPAQLVGRGAALLSGLAVNLEPAGWRLSDAPGGDHRRARALVRNDLDLFEEVGDAYQGTAKFSAAGPWTLAASIERPRGDRAVGDPGARRDVVQSLTQGLADQVSELQRRLPRISWLLQLDEPSLPAVLAGSLPRASGFGRHAPVERAEVSAAYTDLLGAVGVPVIVHCCAPHPPIELLHRAGTDGVATDLAQLDRADWDALGPAMESGLALWAGALPTAQLAGRPAAEQLAGVASGDRVAAAVLRPLRSLRLDPAAVRLVLTPACGLAGATPAAATAALRALRTAAGILDDELGR